MPDYDFDDLVVQKRLDGPPLRYKGRRQFSRRKRLAHNSDAFVEIWARNRGGLVVAHSAFVDGRLVAHAMICKSLTDCAVYLEKRCQSIGVVDSPMLRIEDYLKAFDFRQKFPILVGEFLYSISKHDFSESDAQSKVDHV